MKRMLRLAAPPMPAKKVRGMLTTRAQGQEMTRNMRARLSQVSHVPAPSRGGSTKSNAARPTTAGVYRRAKRVMKRSVGALPFSAVSMRRRTRAAVDCS